MPDKKNENTSKPQSNGVHKSTKDVPPAQYKPPSRPGSESNK